MPHTNIHISNYEHGSDGCSDNELPVMVATGDTDSGRYFILQIGPVNFHFAEEASIPDLLHRISLGYLQAQLDYSPPEEADEAEEAE